MLGAFTCPHCMTQNACDCENCKPYIKEGEYVNKWDESGEHHRYYNDEIKTFNQFVNWVKNKYGESVEYKIDNRTPSPIYVFNGNV